MKGPKTLLAEAISGALEDYFVVDKIESQLLADAAVKLRDTALKPQDGIAVSATTEASVRGIVHEVALQWHWGKSEKEGGSDWVKDAALSIRGLDFTLTLTEKEASSLVSEDNKPQEEVPEKDGQSPGGQETTTGGLMKYAQNQIERIIDTLSLTIQDCTFTVVLPDESKVQVGFSDIEITSMGRQVDLPLLQELVLEGLYCVAWQNNQPFPVLEKLAYTAKAKRTFGKRFSSLNRGVEVMGQSSDNGVLIHAGKHQIEIISKVIDILLEEPITTPKNNTNECTTNNEIGNPEKESTEIDANRSSEKESEGFPSFIQLPLSGVSLVLPNETTVAVSELLLKYQMDGSIFSVEGKQGVTVNQQPFLELGETSLWIADLTTSEFRLEDPAMMSSQDGTDEFVAYFHGNAEGLSNVSTALTEALGVHQETSAKKQHRPVASVPDMEHDEETASPWKVRIPGVVGCLYAQEDVAIELELCNVDASLGNMTVTSKISKFHYPGILQLTEAIERASIVYDAKAKTVFAEVGDVVVVFDESKNDGLDTSAELERDRTQDSPPSTKNGASGVVLPCGLHLAVDKFLAFKPDGKSVSTTLEHLKLAIDPVVTTTNPPNNNQSRLHISLKELNHDMLRLQEPALMSTLVLGSDLDVISDFNFGAKCVHVAAGYSIKDWKALLPQKKGRHFEKSQLKMPNAKVTSLKVIAIVKGIIGVNDSVVQVAAFDGTETTTLDDIIQFYSMKVTSHIPGMIANTQVLGVDVKDNVVSHYGGALLGNLVGGAGIGGLMSVAAFDGVRNTIKEGKVSRGVEETDQWKFSDFASGLQHAAKRAAREGAAKRGKNDGNTGDAIDWAIGAGADATKYVGENKSRLAGAGAGAAGFAYGLALGGPVGAIVGTLVASAATQRTVETIDEATKKISIGNRSVVLHDTNPNIKKEKAENEVLFSGILLKRRDFVKWDWRTHIFVLRKGSIEYCALSEKPPSHSTIAKDEADVYYDSSNPQKSIKFSNHYVGPNDQLTRPKSNMFAFAIFSLESSEPLWTLAALSEDERTKWLSKISEVLSAEDGNDVRATRVSLPAATKIVDPAMRDSLRKSLPAGLRELM